ncbi:MAG: bifunctional DNA-formamidopyrimidine glycosylase/DNA-(apurinic or apyrimidinic site) lyase [Candidatus Binatia bacterium]|nr:bifunctional DNA-formamidopyrimidine glycosylase/DNA-(apurinic or apyrimidinic site) lyase [Candidatus Binatia bacterium]
MPELPEVETVCRTLRPHLVGRRIENVEVRERRLRRPIAADLEARLVGRTIRGVRRRAKYVLIDVGDDEDWVVHLGMSGRLCAGSPPAGLTHVHVVVALSGDGLLYYRDPRRFGLMLLSRGGSGLGELGAEPLEPEFCADLLWRLRKQHRRVTVKSLLMDSRKIVGVGNIYANEALFEAGVRPGRRFGRVTRAEIERLAEAVPAVLARAIESGGSSLLDYRDGEGRQGAFQRSFHVYGREGEPCHACGALVRSRVLGGRGSFYCPGCQA